MRLKDKTAIITGAGAGIGEATARLFAKQGARVLVADRHEAAARTVAEAAGGQYACVDVADETSVRAMAEVAAGLFGRVDILVNNAGYGLRGSVVTTSVADWDALMGVNVRGVFLCSKYLIPLMPAGSSIVNVASNVANVGLADRAAYVASKGAVAALSRAMALDHANAGIRVNAVAPGTTWSSYFDRILETHENPEGFIAALNARAPMNRVAKPEEIAHAILWLASGESSYATGSILTVDGGMTTW
jgi:NAD(P)-dependent dehydrogenase (short-subunit alcohol dehydrogenase family)